MVTSISANHGREVVGCAQIDKQATDRSQLDIFRGDLVRDLVRVRRVQQSRAAGDKPLTMAQQLHRIKSARHPRGGSLFQRLAANDKYKNSGNGCDNGKAADSGKG